MFYNEFLTIYLKAINLLNKIISKNDKKSFYVAIIFIIVSIIQSFTDILLIISLIPLLTRISDPSLSQGIEKFIYTNWQYILEFFGIYGVWLVAGVTAILSSLMKIISYYLGLRFASRATSEISRKLFRSRIYRPFDLFINESISSFQAELTYIDLLENKIFKNFSKMINCIISLIIISCGIILIDAKSFIIISLALIFIYLLISYFSRNAISKLGTRLAVQKKGMLRLINEIVNNIRSIILFDLRNFKLNKLSIKESKYRKANLWISLLAVQPKFLIEGISLFLICIWGAWLNYSEGYNQAILSVGTLIFGFRRLLPDMQQIYVSYSQFKSNEYIVNLILDKLETKEREDYLLRENSESFNKKINIKLNLQNIGYKKNFEDKEVVLLDSASLSIKNGDSLLITGKSGSGKSTFLNIISGLQRNTTGKIFAEINNRELSSLYNNTWRSLVSYIPQEIELVNGTIQDNIIYSENNIVNYKLLRKVCNICGIPLVDKKNGFSLSSIIGESNSLISGGQIQRVGIARGLYKKRPVIIFDESTSALDKESEFQILSKIQKTYKNNIFIMVSHNTNLNKIFPLRIEISKI